MGLAQKLFVERGGKPFAIPKKRSFTRPSWPLIEEMLSKKHLAYVDYSLAERLLRDYPESGEEVAVFLCHLSIAMREGHLCIDVSKSGVIPDPRQIWLETWDEETSAVSTPTQEQLQKITELIICGAEKIPQGLIADVTNNSPVPAETICRYGHLFYFQRYWHYESLFLNHFRSLLHSSPEIIPESSSVHESVQKLEQQKQLLPEQAAAILAACQNSLTILCGGPGTGKTHTAGNLIKIFWTALTPEQRQQCEIALAAPTGKAAANLQTSLARAVSELTDFPLIKAKTLHSLLGIRNHKPQQDPLSNTLTADLILVDESSMIDANMMAQLLTMIKPGARLILLGDKNQLPPVAAGTLFTDIISYSSKAFPEQVIELKTCLRAELKSIVDFAAMINCGDSDSVIRLLEGTALNSGVNRLKLTDDATSLKNAQQALLEYIAPYFPNAQPQEDALEKLLEAYQHFRILSPLRKGAFGIEELNRLLFTHLTKRIGHKKVFTAPIMLVSNDYHLELFNGEVGVLVRHGLHDDRSDASVHEEDYAIFLNRNPENATSTIRKLPALLLPKYEYAYCLSVHKSQGSEFEHVLLLMPEGAERFGREVLYTAATRARKKLEVWGSDSVLHTTVARQACRLSGVVQRLNND